MGLDDDERGDSAGISAAVVPYRRRCLSLWM